MTTSVPRHLIVLMAITASLAIAQSASAQDFCVAPNTTCGGSNVASFQAALDLASADTLTDRIYLGAATYVAPTPSGFNYLPIAAPVEIAGAGVGKTIITAPAGSTKWTLRVTGGGASIHDLSVKLPPNVAAGYVGLKTDAWVERVDVSEDPPQVNQRAGVDLDPYGALRLSTVTIKDDGTNSRGVRADGTNEIWASTITGEVAVNAGYGTLIGASRLTGRSGLQLYTGVTTVSHSIIKFTGANGAGISAGSQPGADTELHADGVVISGPGSGSGAGVVASTSPGWPTSVNATVVNSVIRGAPHPLRVVAGAGPAHAELDGSYSDFDPAGASQAGPNAALNLSNDTNLGSGARFVDAASGDFHLRSASPLIDAGDPASPPGFDLDLMPVNLDGDGDGIARRDVGAYEAPAAPLTPVPQPQSVPTDPVQQSPSPSPVADTQPPVLSALGVSARKFAVARAATAVSARVARGARLRWSLSESATVTIRIERAVMVRGHKRWRAAGTLTRASHAGPSSIRFSGRIGRRALRPGSYRAVVRATDAAGNRSGVRRAAFSIVLYSAGSTSR